MRIAHINNIADVASTIAGYQKSYGHIANVYVFNKIIYEQFGGIKVNFRSPISMWKFFRKLKKNYDVWHYHYPYGSLKRMLNKLNKDKIYLKHYHGDDLRGRHDDDFCLVSTPDLLKYAPNGKWLPTPIDLKEVEATLRGISIQENKIPIVVHYPYYKNNLGIDYYSRPLSVLQKDRICKTVEILNLSHSSALRVIASCDIVVGKILPEVGWFGKFELEGMALGKPVIAYVSDELYELYKPPVFRTQKDTFKKDLETLIANAAEKKRLSTEGQKYVRINHDAQTVVQKVIMCYEEKQINE